MSDTHFNKDKGSPIKLFTPGPVKVPERVLDALKLPNDTHRSTFYRELHQEVKEGLQKLLYTKNECLIFPSSATGVMEGCIRNLLDENEKGLFLSIGAFGDRWYSAGVDNGKNCVKEGVEWGKAITPEFLQDVLSKDKYSVVFLQSCETSTGVYNPIDELVPIIKDYGALACVDGTSSMAGIKAEVDKIGIDVFLASVQKCFALPPGIAVASISEEALAKATNIKNRGMYFDFITLVKKNKVNECPNTPAIPQIRGLAIQLDYFLNQEGLENRFNRHAQLGKRTRIWARDMNLEMFPEKGYESDTVSTMNNSLNIDMAKAVKTMLEKGYRIVNGYGDLVNKTFRIGHMGEITIQELEEMLKILSDVITRVRLDQDK
ncbi:MAG: alanine--glyoxylate aminotransferase family protein [Candidatus Lokiarchaeota archaeon]|nr:alanine--glyoxylate aminotransferase family protein [Candidatus Lokiarchaeota archaeon]